MNLWPPPFPVAHCDLVDTNRNGDRPRQPARPAAPRTAAPPRRHVGRTDPDAHSAASLDDGLDDGLATVVFNRAALDDALHQHPPHRQPDHRPGQRPEQAGQHAAPRAGQQWVGQWVGRGQRSLTGVHRRDDTPGHTTGAVTQTGPTPSTPNAGAWLALVIAGCGIVVAMLALTVLWN